MNVRRVTPTYKVEQYALFLDDFRSPDWKIEGLNWIVVRNYLDFVGCIIKNGVPKFVSFDHDLDRDENMVVRTRKYGEMDGVNVGNGLDCARFLTDFCIRFDIPFPQWHVHSYNKTLGPKITEFLKGL